VKPVAGTWFHLGHNERVRGAEFHRLTITTQDGTTVRGVYSSVTAGDRPLSGTLGSGRGIRLRLDSEGLEFEGTVSAAILAEDQPMSLRGVGGSIDGLTLRRFTSPHWTMGAAASFTFGGTTRCVTRSPESTSPERSSSAVTRVAMCPGATGTLPATVWVDGSLVARDLC
jgi:hypothetical protein